MDLFETSLNISVNNGSNFSLEEGVEPFNVEFVCIPFGYYLKLLHTYYIPFIVVFGFLGNFLSFTVFMSKHLNMRSSSYYLASLAVADSGYLTVLSIVQCSFNGLIEIYNTDGWCQFFVYISSVCSSLSVWLIVAFTVERFVAVQYPLQRPRICTVRRARTIVVVLVIVALGSQSYVFWIAGIIDVEGNEECEMIPKYYEFMKIVNFIDTLFTLIIPFVLIVVMNFMIAKGVFSFRKRLLIRHSKSDGRNESSGKTDSQSQQTPSQSRSLKSTMSQQSCLQLEKEHKPKYTNNGGPFPHFHIKTLDGCTISARNQNSITKMLLLISSVFIALNFPSYIIRLWVYFAYALMEKSLPETFWCIQQFVMLLYYTNFSINFLLYAMCGVTFRRCLWKILRLK